MVGVALLAMVVAWAVILIDIYDYNPLAPKANPLDAAIKAMDDGMIRPVPECVTLAGLHGVGVRAGVSEALESHGVTEEASKIALGLQLRKNGVTVLDDAVWPAPVLAASIAVITDDDQHMHTAMVTLDLHQAAYLRMGDGLLTCHLSTWNQNVLLRLGTARIKDGCRGALEDLADQFSKDWLVVHQNLRMQSLSNPDAQRSGEKDN